MKMPLTIKVHPVVHEYYVSRNGSSTIEIKPNDDFSYRIKTILQLQPKTYSKNPLKKSSTLTLLLPKLFKLGSDKRINTTSRNYLDDRRQYLISKELYNEFKGIFHNYVLAYVIAQEFKRGSQKDGIESFCIIYKLSLNAINFEMLKKSWDRSEQKNIMDKCRKYYLEIF